MRKFCKIFISFLPVFALFFISFYVFDIEIEIQWSRFDFFLLFQSYLVLTVGFLLKAEIWLFFLRKFKLEVNPIDAYASQYKSLLMKYIPGKIWPIIGRAHYLEKSGIDLQKGSIISFFCQLIMTITGIFVGIGGLFIFQIIDCSYVFISLSIILFLIFAVFLSREKYLPLLKYKFIPKKLKSLEIVRIPAILDLILICIFHWLVMGFSFLLFFWSFQYYPDLYPILLQPLATNIGVIASFVPAGLGIQEGAMITYLSTSGIDIGNATYISILARIWFLGIEIVLYFVGVLIGLRNLNFNR